MKSLIFLLLLFTGEVGLPTQSITKIFTGNIAPIIDNFPKGFEVQRRTIRRTRRTTRRAPNRNPNQNPAQRNRSGLFGGLFSGLLLGGLFGSMFNGFGGGSPILILLLIGGAFLLFTGKIGKKSYKRDSENYTDNYSENHTDNDDDVIEEVIEEIYENDVLVETRRISSDSKSSSEIIDIKKENK